MIAQSLAEPQMNATPLIDVLLVLMVMLIFTVPMATHSVKLNLPHGQPAPPSPFVEVAIDFDGQLHWNGNAVSGIDVMEKELRALAAKSSLARVKVTPDRRAPYDAVAQVLAAAQRSHITRLEVTSFAL